MLEPQTKSGYQLSVQAWYPEHDEFSEGDCFVDFETLEDAEQFANDLLADVKKLRAKPNGIVQRDYPVILEGVGIPEVTNYDD